MCVVCVYTRLYVSMYMYIYVHVCVNLILEKVSLSHVHGGGRRNMHSCSVRSILGFDGRLMDFVWSRS